MLAVQCNCINFIDVCPGVSSHSTVEVSTATPEAALSQVEGQTQCHSSCLVLTSLHDSTTPNFVLLSSQSHEHQLDTGRSVCNSCSDFLDQLAVVEILNVGTVCGGGGL